VDTAEDVGSTGEEQTMFLSGWMVLNVVGWVRNWDPYPFILMNLVLSCRPPTRRRS
jgi:hypothetical protein